MGILREGRIIRYGKTFGQGWHGFWGAMRFGAAISVGAVGINEGINTLASERPELVNPMAVHQSAECQTANKSLKADWLTKAEIEACLSAIEKS